jgi:glycerol-3-phosphate acyltransferase PlsY
MRQSSGDQVHRPEAYVDPLAITLLIGATLLGSVPFGFVLAKHFLKIDLQEMGSGNIGATNAMRAGGAKFGAAILMLDAAKGLAAPLLARFFGFDEAIVAGCGLAAVIGHCYTPFLRFRGGKGVATSLGVILALAPALGAVGIGAYALTLILTKTSALGSLAGTGAAVALAWFLPFYDERLVLRLVLSSICALIVWRHRSNLYALRQAKGDKSL